MNGVDLNLLAALDVLLAEGSVTGAARRLGLSASAMSRTLARLRVVTGDALLVRAGRGLVPTPHASALRDRVHALSRDARAVLRPPRTEMDIASLAMSFTIRASESFLEFLAGPVVTAVNQAAPGIRLCFAARSVADAEALREGEVDLEIGRRGPAAPELRTQFLFHDRLVGVARRGHPLLAEPGPTPERFAACAHIGTSREGATAEDIGTALARLGLVRRVMVVVPGYPDAMRIARQSDLVALAPHSCLGGGAAQSGLDSFELPFKTGSFIISAMWHPRMDADPAHRWLRERVMAVCRQAYPRQ